MITFPSSYLSVISDLYKFIYLFQQSSLRNLFLTLLLLLWLGSGSPLSIACPILERNFLLNFKAAVVDEHNSLHSWQGFNCCVWDGVHCNFDRGHVAELDLRGYHLGGYIHPSLFNLAQLEHLDLSQNSFFSIQIPSHIGKLKSLTFLDLLSAAVPYGNISSASLAHLSNLTSLEYLSLGGARILSSKWGEAVGRLSTLKYLRMSDCDLTGQIPRSLVNLTSLLHLHLNDNSLSAEIPSWFENVTSHLLSLHLSNNELFGSIPAYLFLSAHQLHQLNLSWNPNLGGLDVSVIAQHTSSSLNSIDLSVTDVEGQIPSAIGNMSSLERLYLMYTNIEGVIPPSIGNLSELVDLDLSVNKLNGTIPSTISNLVKLEMIALRFNSLSGSIEFSVFYNMTKLQHLLLGSNLVTVSVNSTWIAHFENLLSLGLHSCNLAAIPSFIENQYYLESLVLSANNITGNIPSWIWDLPNLQKLVLKSNRLTGSLPPTLTPDVLQTVDLNNNSLQEMIGDMVQSTTPILDRWKSAVREGGGSADINVDDDITKVTADIIARTSFGASYEKGKQVFDKLRTLQQVLYKPSHLLGVPGSRFINAWVRFKTNNLGKEIDGLLMPIINARQRFQNLGFGCDLLGCILAENEADMLAAGKRKLTTQEFMDE